MNVVPCRFAFAVALARAADATALRYKTNYAPHERLVRGKWERFERPEPRVEPLPPDALVPLGEGEEAIGLAALGLPTEPDSRRDSE